jgi:DNA-binding transcriptional ArsR family regulator
VLPSTADLRFVVESNTSRTGSILLRVFDDMVLEMKQLNQASFTYPCRPAAKRLGISHMAVSRHLHRMVELGYIYLDRQGTAYEGRENLASIYSFAFVLPTSKPSIGQDPITCLPTTPKAKKKPTNPCTVANLRKLDAAFGEPLTFKDVLANGGTVVHWKRWLRHLQRNLDKLRKDDKYCEEQETKDARVRLRMAEKDPDGHRAVEDHRIERDRKNRRWVRDRVKNSAGPIVVSPLRKMLEVVGFGIDPKAPDGTAVTFEYTEIFVCEEQWNGISYGRNHECLILTPQDDVSATMLAAVGYLDPTDLGRVEEVMGALSALKVIVKATGG